MDWPAHWEADVATADGGTVHLRPITPDDADRLVAFHSRQSPESISFRFFSARPRLSPADVRRFTEVDVVRHPLVQKIILAYERRDAERRAAKPDPEPGS